MLLKIDLGSQGLRSGLHANFNDIKVILDNKQVGVMSGRMKCQFMTDKELHDNLRHVDQLAKV